MACWRPWIGDCFRYPRVPDSAWLLAISILPLGVGNLRSGYCSTGPGVMKTVPVFLSPSRACPTNPLTKPRSQP